VEVIVCDRTPEKKIIEFDGDSSDPEITSLRPIYTHLVVMSKSPITCHGKGFFYCTNSDQLL
jgi:hypothetical protein